MVRRSSLTRTVTITTKLVSVEDVCSRSVQRLMMLADSIYVQHYDSEIEDVTDTEIAELDEHWIVHDIFEEGKKVQAIFFGGSTVIPPDFAPSVAQNPTWNSAIGALIATLSLLFTTFGLGSVIVVFIYRNEGVIKKASWKSLLLISLGTCLVSASPLLYIGSLNRAVCIGQPFLLNVGFGKSSEAHPPRAHDLMAHA
ncbi:hypothetical protein BC832DRAFT_88942 [Gaertneriomyces semiglobifer]|nr:hypothetical protein BC832DRAFT_88942 [Gaertneriomyces semiglobifer]